MDKSIRLPSGDAAWGKSRHFDETIVAVLGVIAFCLVVAASIAIRLNLESAANAAHKQTFPYKPASRTLVRGDVLVPVTLSIKLDHGKATLRGTVPDEKSRDTVLNRAKEIYGPGNVEDRLEIQPGILLTPWFDAVLKWFPPRVEQIHSGEISVSGMNVLLFGEVTDIAARIAAGKTLAKLAGPEGQLVNDLQVAQGDATAPPAQK